MTNKCLNWLENNSKESPTLVIDLEEVKSNYSKFMYYFKGIDPYYAVKANPEKRILKLLNKLGCNFDCASINEIKECKKLKIRSEKISFGNTIKKSTDIKEAANLGINLFVFDCIEELYKISENAPNTKVFCRIQVPNGGAEWPLSKKFGCNSDEAGMLLFKAKQLNLTPIGLSFHVGSQQLSEDAWEQALKISSKIYKNLAKKGLTLNFLNLGGGLPVAYKDKNINFCAYSKNIKKSLIKNFGNVIPTKIILEPGRFLVASAGVIESEVILISKRGDNKSKWIYLDVGRYNGLAETEGEAIKYNIKAKGYKNVKKSEYILAGPSCDSHDLVYEKNLYKLPKDLKIGDRLRIFSAGAYTTAYETNFNGIKKIKKIFLD